MTPPKRLVCTISSALLAVTITSASCKRNQSQSDGPASSNAEVATKGTSDVGTVEARVKNTVAEIMGIPADKINTAHRFKEDLGTDELDEVEIVMALEEAFDVEIKEAVAAKMLTVADVIQYFESLGK